MILVAFAISGIDIVRAQNAADKLQPRVEISARRLALSEQVALAKWDSHTSVEDPSREDQLQTALIVALADTAIIRARTTCHADIAKAVGKYTSSYKGDRWCVQTIALDRALAAACTF